MVIQCQQIASLQWFVKIHAAHFSNQSSDLYPLYPYYILSPLYPHKKITCILQFHHPILSALHACQHKRKTPQVLRLYQDKNTTYAVGSNSLINVTVCGCIEEGQPDIGPYFCNMILAWSKITHSDFLLAGSLRECPQPSENQA